MTTQDDIEALARKIAQEALDSEKLESRVDALKCLTPIYLSLVKGRGNNADDDDEPTMDDITTRLRVVEEHDNGSHKAGRISVGDGRRRDA